MKYFSFEDFCLDFNNNPLSEDIHFMPIYEQITINNKIYIDEVGRFENIKEDFARIISKFKKDTKLDVHFRNTGSSNYNKTLTTKPRITLSPYYSIATKNIVSNFYKQDLEYFGYTF